MNTKVKDADTLRIERELSKMKPKEIAERAVASGVMIHNLEMKYNAGIELSEAERNVISTLNKQLDVMMKMPLVKAWFEHEVALGGTPILWTPG